MSSAVRPGRLIIKTVLLFLGLEYALTAVPVDLGGTNTFRLLHVERDRFPVSTLPPFDAALDVGNLQAMFASHIVARPKAANEFRVLVLGDSAVWGLQLEPSQTLPAQLGGLALKCGNRNIRFYNLSFPRSSASKDLMILDVASQYQPDLILWLITWYTLMPKTRIDHWLVTQNSAEFLKLARRFDFVPKDYQAPTFLDDVLTRNSSLFRWARYQLFPLVQFGIGEEQIAGPPEGLPSTLSPDVTFEGLKPPSLRRNQVSIDQVVDFYELSGSIPVLLINEPMLIVEGVPNSDIRYNSYYPRWVYDQYRQYVQEAASTNGWNYLDLWDSIPARYFDDTPLHLKPEGQHLLAEALAPEIQRQCQ